MRNFDTIGFKRAHRSGESCVLFSRYIFQHLLFTASLLSAVRVCSGCLAFLIVCAIIYLRAQKRGFARQAFEGQFVLFQFESVLTHTTATATGRQSAGRKAKKSPGLFIQNFDRCITRAQRITDGVAVPKSNSMSPVHSECDWEAARFLKVWRMKCRME